MTFFFSSRRRHTTFSRDWSSDVCSSDLALVSCGNTGALMAGGTVRLRTLDGIDRPALAAIIPRANGHFILIDAGANPQARSEERRVGQGWRAWRRWVLKEYEDRRRGHEY